MPLIRLLSRMPAAPILSDPLATSQTIIIRNLSAALTKQTTPACNTLFLDFVDSLHSWFFSVSFAGSSCYITTPQTCSSCHHVSNTCDRRSHIICAECPRILP